MATISIDKLSKSYDNENYVIQELSLYVKEGEFLVLVGPSGCGKSTTLRMIAGLEDITSGDIKIDEKIINNIPSGKRDIGMVFQNYALYPHLTVKENLSFPLKVKKVKKSIINQRVTEIATLVQLSNLLDRYPKQLSGGQRQRVALGRAIVRHPKVFLFDEPLSNLDAKLRTQMRNEIVSLQRKLQITSIYVTHDQTEAMTMGDRIVLMNNGQIMQIGTPEEIYKRPSNLFTAEFIGSPKINILSGDQLKYLNKSIKLNSQTKHVAIRPDDISLINNNFTSELINIENLGHEYLYHFKLGEKTYISRKNKRLDLTINQKVGYEINEKNILQYDENENLLDD